MNTIKSEQEQKTEIRREQENKELKSGIHAEQDDHRRLEVQDALKHLQFLMNQENPVTDTLNEALLKSEELLLKEARSPNLDPSLQKLMEDFAQLVGAAKQLSRQNNLGERVGRIADETKKALEEVRLPGVSKKTVEATTETLKVITTVRPIFELLVSSREFRQLIVDSFEILRRIFIRHGSEPKEIAKEKFIEGDPAMDIAITTAQKSADTFKDEEGKVQLKISDEEWTSLQDDVTRVLASLAQHGTYHMGIESLFNLIDILRDELRKSGKSEEAHESQFHARRARMETEDMIASFSGRKVLDEFLDSARLLIRKVDKDERSRNYLRELREFILSTKSAEYIQSEEFKQRSRNLADEARDIVREYQYTWELDAFLDNAQQLVDNIKDNEFLEVLRYHAGVVADDLSYVDVGGNVVPDMDLLKKLRSAIIPRLAESLKYIPIPRIESSDDKRDYWVDNIVLCGYDVIPDRVRVQLESDSDVSIRDIQTKHAYTRLVITLSQIRTELKDMDFSYKKKTFPELAESGRFSLRLGGPNGATLKLYFKIEKNADDPVPQFKEGFSSFAIDQFDISFDKTTINHDVLLPLFSQMFKAQIKLQIENEVENSLNSLIGGLGENLSAALTTLNRPIMYGIDKAREAVKSTEFGQTYEKRQQKLE